MGLAAVAAAEELVQLIVLAHISCLEVIHVKVEIQTTVAGIVRLSIDRLGPIIIVVSGRVVECKEVI